MSSLNVHVGESVNIELSSTGHRCWGEIVGYKPGQYILVEPGKGHKTISFLAEDNVTVRCIGSDNGVLCGFRTSVARYLSEPFPQIILYFPNEFEQMQLRNECRYHCFCPVELRHNEISYQGMILNISDHGAKVQLASPEAVGDEAPYSFAEEDTVSLDVTPFGAPEPVVLEATIKRITERENTITLGVHLGEVFQHEALFEELMETCRKYSEAV